jgi:hypothetical protein
MSRTTTTTTAYLSASLMVRMSDLSFSMQASRLVLPTGRDSVSDQIIVSDKITLYIGVPGAQLFGFLEKDFSYSFPISV